MCHEQLVIVETCKDVLKISHDLSKVTSSQDDEFFLVEVKKNEIRKRFPTYDKVFLQAFIFKNDFHSCLLILESNEINEVIILKNEFNCDISSNVQTDFEMVSS